METTALQGAVIAALSRQIHHSTSPDYDRTSANRCRKRMPL